jgi:ATP-dependent DNA helicase RecQ
VVNLGRGRIEAMLKVLDVEGAVARAGPRWVRRAGADWRYDADRYAEVTALRRREQAAMAAFGADGRCLMRALQEELDDPDPRDCGRCSVCAGPRFDGAPDAALVREAQAHLRAQPLTFDAKRMAPDPDGAMKKIPEDVRVEDGRALARAGDAGWAADVEAGLREGRLDDEVIAAAATLVKAWEVPVHWVVAVPSRRGDAVPDAARRLAAALGLPFHDVVARTEDRPPQSEMANAAQQAANVRGAFAITDDVPPAPCLLVDDRRLSGWTLAMVGGQLRRRGSGPVHPLVFVSSF